MRRPREKRIKKKRAFTITELALEEGKDCLVLSRIFKKQYEETGTLCDGKIEIL